MADILNYFIPLFLMVIVIESAISNYFHKDLYSLEDTIVNFTLAAIGFLLDLSQKWGYLVLLTFLSNYSIFSFSNKTILYWVSLFLIQDLSNYFMHFLEHKVKFLWAVHVTHHSSNKFNFSTGFRSSVFQPFYRYLFFIPIILIGYSPIEILFFYSVGQIYGFFIHTTYTKKIWGFDFFFNTPSHHRVHHACNEIYLDKNMGQVLIIWDRLFNTFVREKIDTPVQYGITKGFKSNNIFKIIFTEFKELKKNGH